MASTPTETLPPTETSIPTEMLTPTPSVTATPTQTLYIVQTGDTLGGIALRFRVTVEAIQTFNNLDTTLIYVGQALQIPRS
jgi:LysM repeat protein